MFDLGIFLLMLVLGYAFGRAAESSHYRSILAREAALQHIPVVASRLVPDDEQLEGSLVSGSVVISVDFFKRFAAGLRNLLGGRVTAYESLVDRARREAVLRMKQEAADRGAEIIFNIKLETSSIYKGRKNAIGSVEVLAYGTALRRLHQA